MDIAQNGANANKRMNDIIDDLYSSKAYQELKQDRDANSEIASIMSWVAKNSAKNFIKVTDSGLESDDAMSIYDIPKRPPRVEKFSFFDMLYKAIRRNQIIDNKRMAMITTLSICSWILTLGVRFRGVCPNLMLLLVAPSGSGKTTSTRAIKEIIKLEKKLKKSYGGQDIRTDAAIFSAIQQSPVNFYFIDEATKLLKSAKNSNSHNANVGEILSQLYSDYKVTDPPMALAKLKNESYGVAIGAKVVTLMSSTESFWKVFDEENYTQGFGRRLFIVTSSDIPLQKKTYKYEKEFFREEEKKAIYMFLKAYLGGQDLYEEVDISDYEIVQEISNKEGIKKVTHYKTCKKPKIRMELTCDEETDKFLAGDFIELNNKFKIKAAGSGSNIQQYVANSRSEFILKLAMIHAVMGKKMTVEGETQTDLQVAMNTIIDMKSIKWATDMFNYYMVGSTLEQIDALFKKDVEMDKSKSISQEFLERLEEKNITEFKKSDQVVRNFFKKIGGSNYRNTLLKEIAANDLITIEGDVDSYKCLVRVNEWMMLISGKTVRTNIIGVTVVMRRSMSQMCVKSVDVLLITLCINMATTLQ
jgi:energy-coupling factor transporter ATP-binding protein EcfA2